MGSYLAPKATDTATFRDDNRWIEARLRYLDEASVLDEVERVRAAFVMYEIEREYANA